MKGKRGFKQQQVEQKVQIIKKEGASFNFFFAFINLSLMLFVGNQVYLNGIKLNQLSTDDQNFDSTAFSEYLSMNILSLIPSLLLSLYGLILAFSGDQKRSLKRAWVFKLLGIGYLYVMGRGAYESYINLKQKNLDWKGLVVEWNSNQLSVLIEVAQKYWNERILMWGMPTIQTILLFIQCYISVNQEKRLVRTLGSEINQPKSD